MQKLSFNCLKGMDPGFETELLNLKEPGKYLLPSLISHACQYHSGSNLLYDEQIELDWHGVVMSELQFVGHKS